VTSQGHHRIVQRMREKEEEREGKTARKRESILLVSPFLATSWRSCGSKFTKVYQILGKVFILCKQACLKKICRPSKKLNRDW
jgi:hypothetical protein